MRYFVFFSYNGTSYHGWQYQPNASSVQECMESAFRTLLRQPVTLTAAGRTDTGVHARLMAAHFDLENLLDAHELQDLAFRLNGYLPDSISVERIAPVVPTAHARFDAISRTYEYWVTDVKNPFTQHLITYTRFHLDYDLMNRAAELLLHTDDFASFCKAHSDNKTNLCTVSEARWMTMEDGTLVFRITANRFLRNMVRAVVGTLIEVGKGKMDIGDFRQVLLSGKRTEAGESVPAKGLFLEEITYPEI